jgi:hypothetical protein
MRVTLEGVELHYAADGRVYWSSDWTRMDYLVTVGHLVRRHAGSGTYGHVDYFLPDPA